jgi:hypothetical protein
MSDLKTHQYRRGTLPFEKYVSEQNIKRWHTYHEQLQKILSLQSEWPVQLSNVVDTKCFSLRSGSTNHIAIEAIMGTDSSYTGNGVSIPSYKVRITPGISGSDPLLQVFAYLPRSQNSLYTLNTDDLRHLHRNTPNTLSNSYSPRFTESNGNFIALALLQNLFINSLLDDNSGQIYNEWQKIAGSEMTPDELDSIIYQASQIDRISATE